MEVENQFHFQNNCKRDKDNFMWHNTHIAVNVSVDRTLRRPIAAHGIGAHKLVKIWKLDEYVLSPLHIKSIARL